MSLHLPPELIKHYNDCGTCWWNPGTGYLETCAEGDAIVERVRIKEERSRDLAQQPGAASGKQTRDDEPFSYVHETLKEDRKLTALETKGGNDEEATR